MGRWRRKAWIVRVSVPDTCTVNRRATDCRGVVSNCSPPPRWRRGLGLRAPTQRVALAASASEVRARARITRAAGGRHARSHHRRNRSLLRPRRLRREGRERPEPDGTFLSETLAQRVADRPGPLPTFLHGHGWQGDVPAAIEQFDHWIAAMAGADTPIASRRAAPGFKPLIVGLHWPSLPLGDESVAGRAGRGVLAPRTTTATAAGRSVDAAPRASPIRRRLVPRSARSSRRRAGDLRGAPSPAPSTPTRRCSPNRVSPRGKRGGRPAPISKASIPRRSSPQRRQRASRDPAARLHRHRARRLPVAAAPALVLEDEGPRARRSARPAARAAAQAAGRGAATRAFI